ncbi:unnamed protein product [Allacma fusca]|uniref:Anti-proliferative protein domain-containing protein n=1 Tax=Allacma fusca TaxID=39272 RepID=A0A8J2LCC1_9HEXA|nr:unnamed protein product [Allacma fusca]
MKGSAYRCIKTGQPTDTVIALAASEANVPIGDIIENLPSEMSIWIDPGEVSYRIGEKSNIKILWSSEMSQNPACLLQSHLNGISNGGSPNGSEVSPIGLHNNLMMMDDLAADREVKSFNPDAQVFQPISTTVSNGNNLSNQSDGRNNKSVTPPFNPSPNSTSPNQSFSLFGPSGVAGIVNGVGVKAVNGSNLMTTAAFAQTKFGSTKLKTSSKRTHRMSPTEFSNYIKQRALAQQQAQQQQQQNYMGHHLNNPHQIQSSLIVGGATGNSGGPGQQIHPNVLNGVGSTCSSNGTPSTNMLLQNSLLSQSRPRSISPPTDFLISYEKYNPFESTQIWSNNNLNVVSSNGLDGKNLDFGIPQQQAQQQQQQQLVA